jgi:hypothetical protein
MREVTNGNFGVLVAYLLPGFTALVGLSQVSDSIRPWLITPSHESPTIGGFLYLTVASLACGLLVSTFRWAIIDALHHRTGIPAPAWTFAVLDQKLQAFQLLVESHYRYYQFYANMFVALVIAFAAWAIEQSDMGRLLLGSTIFLVVEVTLFLGSRDTIRKYYRRSEELLSD